MNDIVSFSDIVVCLKSIWKRKLFVIYAAVLGVLIGLFFSIGSTQNEYSAVTTIYSATYGSFTESMVGTNAMLTYADVIKSTKVCDRALSMLTDTALQAEDLKEMITVNFNSEESPILTITATSEDSQKSVEIVNAVASAFIIEIQNITGERNVQVLDEAKTSEQSQFAIVSIIASGILAAIVLAFLMVVLLFVYEFFQPKLRTVAQCEVSSGLNIIGIIPEYEEKGKKSAK